MDDSPYSTLRRAAIWTVLCSISAVPSFVWASRQFDRFAMIVGVGLFIAFYTAVSGTEAFRRFRKRPFVDRTLRIGFGTRLFASIVFPVGMLLDVFPGLISITIVQEVLPSSGGHSDMFTTTLAITLVQGVLLNALLGLYMALIYGAHRVFATPPPPEGKCEKCGYDLRASYEFGRCPECGTPCTRPSGAHVELTAGDTHVEA